MTKALAWIRKSKGRDDDIGLEEQREVVHELADELADETVPLDLGVQTGFSSMTRDSDHDQLLDEVPEVLDAIEQLEAGEYDYLVALDDRRICRDEYLSIIQYAANQGDCELTYVADVAEDDLAYDIHRRVERETKEEEIRKSQAALDRREEKGYDHGRPRFGMEYDKDGRYQVPGENFGKVLKILRMHSKGATFPEISDEVGVSTSTAHRVVDRREWYIKRDKLGEDLTDRDGPAAEAG